MHFSSKVGWWWRELTALSSCVYTSLMIFPVLGARHWRRTLTNASASSEWIRPVANYSDEISLGLWWRAYWLVALWSGLAIRMLKNIGGCRMWLELPSPPRVLMSLPLKGSRGSAASRRQLITSETHSTQGTFSSHCYHRERETGAWEPFPLGSRTAASHAPWDSWTPVHNPTQSLASALNHYALHTTLAALCTMYQAFALS